MEQKSNTQETTAQKTDGKKPKSKFSLPITALLILCVVIGAFFLSRYVEQKNQAVNQRQRQRIYAPMVEDDHPILTKFKSEYPDRKVVLACEEDVTNDQKKDLLIIYKENSEEEGKITRLVIAVAQENGCTYTEPIPAPIDNQGIQFKNIDEENEMEFIVSGEKNGAAGYAIYRMIDGAPVDLFGDGMEDCC